MILIFGLGVSGLNLANFLLANSYNFYITDDNKQRLVEAQDTFKNRVVIDYNSFDFGKVKTLVISPGIKSFGLNQHPIILKCRENAVRVISDLQLLWELNPRAEFIGITGSNGKSTTSSLISHVLNGLGLANRLVGNIGISPFSGDISHQRFVVEISSYQLENTFFNFNIGILLNLSPNHLDRYDLSMDKYCQVKSRIALGQNSIGLIGIDDPYCLQIYQENPNLLAFSTKNLLNRGFSLINDTFYVNGKREIDLPKFKNLIGEHNLQNILACLAVCHQYQANLNEVAELIKTFKSLEHRIEFITNIDGIDFINDSKSTTHNATKQAIKCFDDIYLLVGGKAKEVGIEGLFDDNDFHNRVKKVFLYGESTGKFATRMNEISKPFSIFETLENATKQAFIEAKMDNKIKTILLSPLCASFDQFANFEERGKVFKNIVKHLV